MLLAAGVIRLPATFQAGDAEILWDDSVRFAAAAEAAGVDVTLEIWAEMPHVWHMFAGLLPEADEAIERIGRWLREDRPPAGARSASFHPGCPRTAEIPNSSSGRVPLV